VTGEQGHAHPDQGDAGVRAAWRDHNRAAWDERVPLHLASDFYDVDSFVAGRSTLRSFERAELGPVDGLDLVHLQCHFGQDTLSWAREGARVTGLDFSGPAIAAAAELAARLGVDAAFVQADVYDAVEALGGQRFDVVYTGLGALLWLPDLVRWAQIVAALLRPRGVLYLVEFHPVADVFADDALVVERPYFGPAEGTVERAPGTYTDWGAATEHNTTVEWTHPIGSVVSAVLAAGLHLESFHEHDHTLFERWPFLERCDDFTYRLPASYPSLPLLYSLRARRA
jgi:SAM-dependent methyltransferase